MINLQRQFIPIQDSYIKNLKNKWLMEPQAQIPSLQVFVNEANDWFRSTKRNQITGWDEFPCIDTIMGCTHFIEAFILKHGWHGFQILDHEYSYYRLMGKHGTEPDKLENNKPLIVSIPNWKTCDFPTDWENILKICEARNIDIHIDFAWLTIAKDININLSHPNIKSFAMSLSKYGQNWNRIGLRWSKQRTMDSVSIFNQFYGDVNTLAASCGLFMLQNIPRDYVWNTYENRYYNLCSSNKLIPTKLIPVVKVDGDELSYSVTSDICN